MSPCTKNKGITSSILPRSNAGTGSEGYPRNEAVKVLKEDTLAEWKKDRDYHKLSLAEIALLRYKQFLSPKLTLRDYNAPIGEVLANVKAMNKVLGLGIHVLQ